jgi:hypothetical protein
MPPPVGRPDGYLVPEHRLGDRPVDRPAVVAEPQLQSICGLLTVLRRPIENVRYRHPDVNVGLRGKAAWGPGLPRNGRLHPNRHPMTGDVDAYVGHWPKGSWTSRLADTPRSTT